MDDKGEPAIDRTYAPIGKFVVEFEHLIDAIREIVVLVFRHHGLEKDSMVKVLLSGLTASPLVAVFESLIAESGTLEPQ